MKLTIEPTPHFFMLDQVMVRMWQGTTESGAEIVALVTAVASKTDAPELASQLVSIPPPDAEAASRWAAEIERKASNAKP